jgi:UDP-N-acetylmuramyl pentapeptide phosphotransferase/UDP-N-acetylglucosamine-1-phosphate transferase
VLGFVMSYLPAIFALLVGAAGWFYMFYSRAASNLTGVESEPDNRLRIRLRRVGGLTMIVLAFVSYAACVAIERERAIEAAWYLLAVLMLLGAILVLGLIDLRLTQKLRRARKRDQAS